MPNTANTPGAASAEARKALGIPESDAPGQADAPESAPNVDQEPEEDGILQTDPESPEEGGKDGKEDENLDGDDDDEDGNKGVDPENPPTKKTVPLPLYKDERKKRREAERKAEETERKNVELATELENLKKPHDTPDPDMSESQEVVTEKVREIAKTIAEKRNLDPDGLTEIIEETVKLVVGLTKKEASTLPKDVQDKLKILDEIIGKDKVLQEQAHFDKEWDKIRPALAKRFPTATEAQLNEAKAEMDKFAHSKEFHTQDLDYVFWKNRKTFDTILKTASKPKGGESSSRGVTSEPTGQVDFLSPDMSPQKLAEHDRRNNRSALEATDGKVRFN